VHQAQRFYLSSGESLCYVDGYSLQSQLASCEHPGVPSDNHTLLIDHDRLPPPELRDGGGNLVDADLRDYPRVARVRNHPVDGPVLNFHLISPVCRQRRLHSTITSIGYGSGARRKRNFFVRTEKFLFFAGTAA